MPVFPEPYHSYAENSHTPGRGWSSIVGIVTAIIGNILISFALNTQRYAHIRIDREYKDRRDPGAKQARKHLPKTLRNYGAAVHQEEIAEERARINESAPPLDDDGVVETVTEPRTNGKQHDLEDLTQHHADEDEQTAEEQERQSYLKSPWWWLGIVMMTIGETGNFLAYGFAPASIVSPLGVVALVSNCLIAPLMLKERFRQRDLWGVVIAIGGAVTVVLSAKTQEKKLGPGALWDDIKRWEFLVYVLITTVFIVALMFASPKYGQRTILVDLGLVGLFGGYTVLSTKGVASLLSASLYRAFTYPIMYVLVLILVGSAIMQIRYLNRGLQNFDSTQVIPVQFVLFTLSVIIGSAILYRDFERTDVDHALKFVLGCLLTFGGVYLITSGRKRDDDDEDEDAHGRADEGEQIRLLDEEAEDEPTSAVKHEHEQSPEIDDGHTQLDRPQTPNRRRSSASSPIPSFALTPAASTDDLDTNPWLSSTDHLDRTMSHQSSQPQTPFQQSLPSASSTGTHQTAFFTPRTLKPPQPLIRTTSSPAQPQTPRRRLQSPPKASLPTDEPTISFLRQGRESISRLLPGPILQPLSSSLAGIAADSILKGEGTPSPRSLLRRYRSNREATRFRGRDGDIESGGLNSFVFPTSFQRSSVRHDGVVENPSLSRRLNSVSNTSDEGVSGPLQKQKGRLRSMSDALTNIMERATGRRSSKDDGGGDRPATQEEEVT